MDPLSAIGLVSSVITFIDFGYEVISAAKQVGASATGSTTANDRIEFLNTHMEAVATDLSATKSSRGTTTDTRQLEELADKCLELSNDLKSLLDKLRANNPRSKRQVLSTIVRNVRKKDQKKELEARLDQCRQQLHLQLSHTTRLESLSRLREIAETGRCHEKELTSLNHQLATLKDVVAGLNPHSKLLNEARAVLDLSDIAVSKVLQTHILEALRFEKMESRLDSIEEAHIKTFEWLLEDAASSSLNLPTVDTEDPWFVGIQHHLEEDTPLRLKIRKDFTTWLSHGNGIFHISGKPGAGKSTLMKYLAESDDVRKRLNTWADAKELTFASFFFWKHGTDLQKTLQGLLRSLLYSVLDQHPHLTRMVFPTQWEASSRSWGRTLHFHHSDIQKAFKVLTATPEVYLKHKIAFFIDGLDEFEGHDDTLVKTLFEWANSGSEDIKICVSSRELPIFQHRFSECLKFRLHEVTYHDIFLFVYDTLRSNDDVKLMAKPQDVAHLGNLLVSRAEGVFLWVSLALRLVERGLVLEESIQELRRSIDVLPTELEQLFRVSFDSIKTERDFIKRRRAMRTLSLAVDELQIAACKDNLFLTHLSFMDDYDRDQNFPNHIHDNTNATDRNSRLSRCRKQLTGGCRGLLTIKSRLKPGHIGVLRRETVALAHRSLIEFFQLPDIQLCIEEYSQGFDRMHFYCQSLIAELKVWSPSQEYELETWSHDDPRRSYWYASLLTKSELLYGRLWLADDVRRLIAVNYYTQDQDTSSLFRFLHQLRQIVKATIDSTWLFDTGFTYKWIHKPNRSFMMYHWMTSVRCHPEACIILVALESGLHEFWSTGILENNLCEFILYLAESSLASNWLGTDSNSHPYDVEGRPPFDRLLRSLATCLAGGTSANSVLPVHEQRASFSIWQNLVWKSIVRNRRASPALVWLLFLLHGADRSFTMSFEKSCNFSCVDKSSKLVLITGFWGPDKRQVHTPIHCREGEGGILDLSKSQTWSLSLKELTYVWFAPHADKFRRVYELYENGADVTVENLKHLRRELGFDPEFWQTQVCDDNLPLINNSHEGSTRLLGVFDSDYDSDYE